MRSSSRARRRSKCRGPTSSAWRRWEESGGNIGANGREWRGTVADHLRASIVSAATKTRSRRQLLAAVPRHSIPHGVAIPATILAFATGGVLAMLAESMIPEAFANAQPFIGLIAVVGFLVAFLIIKMPVEHHMAARVGNTSDGEALRRHYDIAKDSSNGRRAPVRRGLS
jgi:hypothetical protein